jgi:hypothetical protein
LEVEAVMTIDELNDLIARGAAQPGVRDAEQLMRLSEQLTRQARELAELYDVNAAYTAAAGTGVVGQVEPTATTHAHLG